MKFACKYCNKSYSCGKALGGHLSSHKMVMDYVDDDYDDDVPNGGNFNAHDDAPDYYTLRKKVKGSGTALDDSSVMLHLHHVCKECGKGFRSLKALCGHMACHSDKERHRYESQTGDKQRRFFVDAAAECSETADSGQMQPCRRSKRVRFMNRARTAEKLADDFSFMSGVMPVEEVARCLMMMSNDRRDAGCWGRVRDYSDSPSFESEDKPPSSGGSRSSEEILYEDKQRYKNLDTFKGGSIKIKRGTTMASEEDAVAVSHEKKCNAKKSDNNRHECPICFRVFKSGQAMGGHKRSHFLQGGVEEAASCVVVTEKEVPMMIDLNLPAFVEEGSDVGIFPCLGYKTSGRDRELRLPSDATTSVMYVGTQPS